MVSEILVQLCLGGGHTSVPRPCAHQVATPPEGRSDCLHSVVSDSCFRFLLFLWVVLTGPWGLRGPALCIWFQRSWSSSALGEATHTHTHTHTRYPDHMETPFQGQCPIHVVFEPWVYNLISHVSWIATHALRNNHIIKLRVAPIPLMY